MNYNMKPLENRQARW